MTHLEMLHKDEFVLSNGNLQSSFVYRTFHKTLGFHVEKIYNS